MANTEPLQFPKVRADKTEELFGEEVRHNK